jgi:DUF1365 family protein
MVTTPVRGASLPTLPAIVRGRVQHRRRKPIDHQLAFTTYEWIVDVDNLPRATRFASFLASDHFGGEAPTLRAAVAHFAQACGEVINAGDRLVMLASARSLGYVFNPLSVYWCMASDNVVRWVILEIHNTYGDRHAHLIHLDKAGTASVNKEFYVSPFLTVDGRYEFQVQLTEDRIVVVVNLLQAEELVFSAAFAGVPQSSSPAVRMRAAFRTPFATYQASARIRFHGVWLWLRRLPVIPRPPHPKLKGFL